MNATFDRGNVRAPCPDCEGTLTTFEYSHGGTSRYGSVSRHGNHGFEGQQFSQVTYVLLRCAGCGRGGMATVHNDGNYPPSRAGFEEFFPASITPARIPEAVPDGIRAEFREAERCAAAEAWRAGSAMLRSVLEKALKANGYTRDTEPKLVQKIDAAAADGVITEARKNRAHDEIRSLGNDILHDDWKPVDGTAFDIARHYAQRVLEDLYDDREQVERQLRAKSRLT